MLGRAEGPTKEREEERERETEHKTQGGKKRNRARQVKDEECRVFARVSVCVFVCARVHVSIWECVLSWTTKQKTLVALPCFINTAVCLV